MAHHHLLGLLKVKIVRGVDLAVRDVSSSDPYVILKLQSNKLKTRVVKSSVNPEWNEDLTLSVSDPTQPLIVHVYDKDTFSADDPMGDAEVDIEPFMESVKMKYEAIPEGAIIQKITPSRKNCFAEESRIRWIDGRIEQDIVLRLRNVESGELELKLTWTDLSTCQTLD